MCVNYFSMKPEKEHTKIGRSVNTGSILPHYNDQLEISGSSFVKNLWSFSSPKSSFEIPLLTDITYLTSKVFEILFSVAKRYVMLQ